ncbi:MAG: radical SAM family heme chaperone HemW [Anaerolineales bacterium]
MNYSLYFHIPFCIHRCAYCDFNTYAGQEDSIPAYVDALCTEIEFIGQRFPDGNKVHTVFFGGGTPSLLSPNQFDSIFHSIRKYFELTEDAEITIEANPGTVSFEQLQKLRAIGINRISFGVQSADSEELRMLERAHDFFDVINSVSWARSAGFENINLDLIYGLPEQTLQTWQTTVKRILDLNPNHISAYALTLEHGTPFGRWSKRGLLPLPDSDLAADMYEWASEVFESSGYIQYEISNWAKPNRKCIHNLQYWRGLPYLGLGAGAHGYTNGFRYSNVLRIKTYVDRLTSLDPQFTNLEFFLSAAAVNHHRQTPRDELSEYMMTGLRLTREGIAASAFRQRFGCELNDAYHKEIDELIRLGLLEWHMETSEVPKNGETSDVLRLTRRGRLLGNQVFMRFLED